jgi:hypothetical protein
MADSLDSSVPFVTADGIRYPAGLEPLIRALQERFVERHGPIRADDDALGLSVLGDFPEPLVGRDSLIRRAERELAAAEGRRSTTEAALRLAETARKLAVVKHGAAKAQARIAAIDEQLKKLDETMTSLAAETGPAEDVQQIAHKAFVDASVKLANYNEIRRRPGH